jgi:hypothetical protein
MAEFLVRFVFDILLLSVFDWAGWLGRSIGRPVITFLSRGHILLDPPPNNLVVVRRWHGVHHLTDGTPVLGKKLTATIGLALLTATIVIALVALHRTIR